MEELEVLEPDELGWAVVYKDGRLYEKKTLVSGNCTINVYDPIPFEKKIDIK